MIGYKCMTNPLDHASSPLTGKTSTSDLIKESRDWRLFHVLSSITKFNLTYNKLIHGNYAPWQISYLMISIRLKWSPIALTLSPRSLKLNRLNLSYNLPLTPKQLFKFTSTEVISFEEDLTKKKVCDFPSWRFLINALLQNALSHTVITWKLITFLTMKNERNVTGGIAKFRFFIRDSSSGSFWIWKEW